MGNLVGTSTMNIFKKKEKKPLPIETMFKLPSPIPIWPPGDGFASGTIDLGGLEVFQVSNFTKIWATHEGGPDNLGATFLEPSSIPDGFFVLGFYAQPNNVSLFGRVLVAKDVTNDPENSTLKQPIDYTLVWSSQPEPIKQDGISYIWLPTPPEGYKAVGQLVTTTPEKPSLDKIRCVRADLTDECKSDEWIWGRNNLNVYSLKPSNIGIQSMGVPTGTFLAQIDGSSAGQTIACLKNVKMNLSSMPNISQINALMHEYSPLIYYHPDEEYLPSSVGWYFDNGALLYKKGDESNPVPIDRTGSNLPQGGWDDDTYWIDLPIDKVDKEKVKKGNLGFAGGYLHVKPMLGATFTDIAIWVFFPFNGPARAKVEFFNISLGKIGEHVGDWEHVTLRVSNFTGELTRVYLSQHSKGMWIEGSTIEFRDGNKPVVYSSLHGHAFYSKPGLVLQGKGGIGIRNDTAKSDKVMDIGAQFLVVAAEYLEGSDGAVVEPPWLNYARKWGPKIDYDIDGEMHKVAKFLPGKLKKAFEKFIQSLPNEVLGEEGPIGPKMKDVWNGDERT
ncbi:uncharacterized protein LOC124921714 [Impatiens glandulifera]|uniref:uncharacterized protein LOC124921714 n=1 Tax=Impatiens glandulifera TaxID=253017 RepID=UPI001FB0737A|nr:uncharacterized protein LOC124921714 [Impatiens glandulifera]